MFCREGRYVEGRFVDGRFMEGRFVEGRFVGVPVQQRSSKAPPATSPPPSLGLQVGKPGRLGAS